MARYFLITSHCSSRTFLKLPSRQGRRLSPTPPALLRRSPRQRAVWKTATCCASGAPRARLQAPARRIRESRTEARLPGKVSRASARAACGCGSTRLLSLFSFDHPVYFFLSNARPAAKCPARTLTPARLPLFEPMLSFLFLHVPGDLCARCALLRLRGNS